VGSGQLRKWAVRALAVAVHFRRTIAGLVALALITRGVWQIYPPAAWIVLGVLLLADLFLMAFKDRSVEP
jgi:hypothetical protein